MVIRHSYAGPVTELQHGMLTKRFKIIYLNIIISTVLCSVVDSIFIVHRGLKKILRKGIGAFLIIRSVTEIGDQFMLRGELVFKIQIHIKTQIVFILIRHTITRTD